VPSLTGLGVIVLGILLSLGVILGGVWTYGRSQYDTGYRAGQAAIAASLDAQGAAAAAAAEAAREPASLPGAMARLRANWCLDCTP
jgi:hypothetical protein